MKATKNYIKLIFADLTLTRVVFEYVSVDFTATVLHII